MNARNATLAAAVACTVAACAAGPDFQSPQAAAPAQWASDAPAFASGEPDATWWRALGSSQLDELITAAVDDNRDLRVALARFQQIPLSAVKSGMVHDFQKFLVKLAHRQVSLALPDPLQLQRHLVTQPFQLNIAIEPETLDS